MAGNDLSVIAAFHLGLRDQPMPVVFALAKDERTIGRFAKAENFYSRQLVSSLDDRCLGVGLGYFVDGRAQGRFVQQTASFLIDGFGDFRPALNLGAARNNQCAVIREQVGDLSTASLVPGLGQSLCCLVRFVDVSFIRRGLDTFRRASLRLDRSPRFALWCFRVLCRQFLGRISSPVESGESQGD